MNRQQAMLYDSVLSEKLQSCAKNCREDETMGKVIVDSFVEFLPEDELKGMIFLNHDPVSYKLGNVRIDLQQALLAGVEFVASVNRPESIFNYIQLLIVSVLFIRNATRQELNNVEAYIIYLLHTKGAYQFGIEEEQFILEMQEWYHEKEEKTLERQKIVNAMEHLYEMKTVDYNHGKVCLKEKVWGRMN